MLAIQLPREIESALLADAAAHGMNASQWAGEVLAQRYGAQGTTQSTVEFDRTSGGFLAMLDASAPGIAAGVLRPITSDDITQAIADARP